MRTRSRTDGPGFAVVDGMFSNMMITCVTPSMLHVRRVHTATEQQSAHSSSNSSGMSKSADKDRNEAAGRVGWDLSSCALFKQRECGRWRTESRHRRLLRRPNQSALQICWWTRAWATRTRAVLEVRVVWSGYACRIMLIVGLNHTLYVSLEEQRGRQRAARGKRWAACIISGTIGVFRWEFDGVH